MFGQHKLCQQVSTASKVKKEWSLGFGASATISAEIHPSRESNRSLNQILTCCLNITKLGLERVIA